jgi:bifunctional DNA-binding transcriptional regulator/antitoxin component of YhaV-PrlF toxin-antitoxin module
MQVFFTSKIYSNKATVPKGIREKLKLKDGDSIIWEIKGLNITVKKNEEKNYTI